jgi:chitinase
MVRLVRFIPVLLSTHFPLAIAFANPSSSGSLSFDGGSSSEDTLKRLISYAHGNDTLVLLSIGGWDGSQYFSTILGDESSTARFVKKISDTVDKFGLDGIDIDWVRDLY